MKGGPYLSQNCFTYINLKLRTAHAHWVDRPEIYAYYVLLCFSTRNNIYENVYVKILVWQAVFEIYFPTHVDRSWSYLSEKWLSSKQTFLKKGLQFKSMRPAFGTVTGLVLFFLIPRSP